MLLKIGPPGRIPGEYDGGLRGFSMGTFAG